MRRIIGIATAAIVAAVPFVLSTPAAHAATAATVSIGNNDITVIDGPGNSADISVTLYLGGAFIASTVPLQLGAGCQTLNGSAAYPHAAVCIPVTDEIFLNGGDGNDKLRALGAGNVAIVGGAGSDNISGGASTAQNFFWGDQILPAVNQGSPGDGNDTIKVNSARPANVDAGGGNDSVTAGGGSDSIYGGPGWDVIKADGARDTIFGGPDSDWLVAGNGQDRLYGEGGNDLLGGGAKADYLNGGPGNDTLEGMSGPDTLDGGTGTDTLKGGNGSDTFYAFDHTVDNIYCGYLDGVRDTVVADNVDVRHNCGAA